ncbi:MAG: putative baseplate assembly protein [Chloroflexi bacterium]|nr:putative baseplate assembly protein [Chloroflexota bacterium]
MSDFNDCCEGEDIATPVLISNCPGLSAIAYRVGTHSRFKETMLARLSSREFKTLRRLSTRQDDDYSIALLDSWALVSDILAFYNERIANESYLRTATERLSTVELGRLIGYALNPGVSATAFLVFDLNDAPGSPQTVAIDMGVKVQSVPNPGEQPQTFETIEAITARPAWNAIKPRQSNARVTDASAFVTLRFQGNQTNLRVGDGIYYKTDNGAEQFGIVGSVQVISRSPTDEYTEVNAQLLGKLVQSSNAATPPSSGITLSATTQQYKNRDVDEELLQNESAVQRFDVDDVIANFNAVRAQPNYALAFHQRAAVFGHNAPPWNKLPAALRIAETYYIKSQSTIIPQTSDGIYKNDSNKWNDKKLDKYGAEYDGQTPTKVIYLDSTYPNMAADTFIVLRDGDNWALLQVTANVEMSKSEFTLTNKVSQITPDNADKLSNFGIQTTTIFGQSEWLPLDRNPITVDVTGDLISLDQWHTGLHVGQTVFVKGESRDERGVIVSEFRTIKEVLHRFTQDGGTRIRFTKVLGNTYIRSTTTINANVAAATHGETVHEILGSGDGSKPFQKFTLKQPPLTYVSADTPSGTLSTLRVFVNDIEWHDVPTLYGAKPEDRVFVTRLSDDSKTTVQFGDGITGARLPTGQENVRATYRRGLGLDGQLKADQLSLLITRPAGVRGVTNPQPTEGGDDPENLAMIRQNASVHVMTLDRVVSLLDYQDFARAFAGVAKAYAVWADLGKERGVFITVAAPRGGTIDEGSTRYTNLLAAITASGDPYVPVRIKSYTKKTFKIDARVKIDPDYNAEKLLAEIETVLRQHFSFEERTFGQNVTQAEVYAVIQNVKGVMAVTLNEPNAPISADLPQSATTSLAPAVLLTLDPAPITLEVMV